MLDFLSIFLFICVAIILITMPQLLIVMMIIFFIVILLICIFALGVCSVNHMISPMAHASSAGAVTQKTINNKIRCFARTVKANVSPAAKKQATESDPYTPQQVGSVYLGNTPYDGTGKKIAIITCFAYPNLQKDFNIYRKSYGKPAKKISVRSYGTATDNGWSVELLLDFAMADLTGPNADLYSFQAKDNTIQSLQFAVQQAIAAKMDIISMSLGADESQGFANMMEPLFAQNPQIIFLAASGDYATVSYPSSSPNVISVGGTILSVASNGYNGIRVDNTPISKNSYVKLAESTWYSPDGTGSGHGVSELFPRPAYQNGHNPSTNRSTPDLSLISASPNDNGVAIYCSAEGGWIGVQGTSVSCPLLAGMIATVNSKRSVPLTRNTIMTYLYSRVSNNLPMDVFLHGAGFVSNRTIDALITA